MKTLTSAAIITIVSVMSFNAMAESKVTKSIVLNKSVNKGNATIALGKNNLASTGSVNIKDSKVSKSIVLNKSVNKGNATIALGKNNTATTGSITIE
ncbi:MAG: hypothetical protein GQ532_19265 [Methylomarinum sp.]|nr:hypothetical protein [Methylomarinum sp.]NOR71795.1 hypothetical protein [Methylomarinum sp.]